VAEVLVVDDASTDDSAAQAREADDGSGRLKILTQPRNAGPSAARNRGIRESSAPWIALLDADDFFLPGRIKRLFAFADKADFIADDIGQVSENAVEGARRDLLGVRFGRPRAIGFAEFVFSNVTDPKRERGELGFIKPLMRRQFLAEHSLAYQEHMHLGEDYELYARSLALGARLYVVPTVGYVSVVRPNSLSGRHSETDLLHLRNCDYLLGQISGLAPLDKKALRAHFLSVDCRYQWCMLVLAVKQRNVRAAFAAFLRPHPVPYYLAGKLAEQVVLRTKKKLKGAHA